jgi:hypothetical protein
VTEHGHSEPRGSDAPVPCTDSKAASTGPPGGPTVPVGTPTRRIPPTARPRTPAARGALPDPAWTEGASICVGCGYSLDGLAAPGICPECGAPFEARQLVLAGVPNSMKAGSAWRRAAWAVLIVLLGVHSQSWILTFRLGWWVPLVILAMLVAGVVGLLMTGPRERGGTERFVITAAGITRVATKLQAGASSIDSIFIPWGKADGVHLKRVSPFWKRLRVGTVSGRTITEIRFDAGIRCPDKDVDLVVGTIQGHLNSRRCAGCGNPLEGLDGQGVCPGCGAPLQGCRTGPSGATANCMPQSADRHGGQGELP